MVDGEKLKTFMSKHERMLSFSRGICPSGMSNYVTPEMPDLKVLR